MFTVAERIIKTTYFSCYIFACYEHENWIFIPCPVSSNCLEHDDLPWILGIMELGEFVPSVMCEVMLCYNEVNPTISPLM